MARTPRKNGVLEYLIAKFGHPLIDRKDKIRKLGSKNLAEESGYSASRIRTVLRDHGVSLHRTKYNIEPKTNKTTYAQPPQISVTEKSYNDLLKRSWRATH